MAEQQATLAAEVRSEQGTSPVRRLRQEGRIPGVMYAEGKEATSITLNEHAFTMELRRHSSENVMISIDVDGAGMKKVLVKDVQRHPLTRNILHVDLQAVSMTEKLQVNVAIELEGEPVGVAQFGGTLEQLLAEAEVECLPTDIPASLVFDVTELNIGDGATVADLVVPPNVEMMTDPEIAVVHVSAPRVAEEEETAEEGEEGEEGAEPEVLTEKSEEGED